MLVFPNAKINLGLNITQKRADGFHNIETVFYPVNWCDGLELLPSEEEEDFAFSCSGLNVEGRMEDNIIYKAWQLLKAEYRLSPVKVHLHKVIPMGAGLGGGSSDAAFFIRLVDTVFELQIPQEKKLSFARKLGSDCAFFIENEPVFAQGKGDEFDPLPLDLSAYKIALIYPGVHSNTREAYAGIAPAPARYPVKEVISNYPVEQWKGLLINDFEKSIFDRYPRIAEIKEHLYEKGAVYAAMSGSGSTVFGLFRSVPELNLRVNEICRFSTR